MAVSTRPLSMPASIKSSTYSHVPSETLDLFHDTEEEHFHSSLEEKQEPRLESRHLWRYWRWEITMFALGTGGFACILVILFRYRNRDYENDPLPYLRIEGLNLQFTALVAALTQVTQSALLVPTASCIGQLKWKWFQRKKKIVDLDRFDVASRGSYGSLQLLLYFSWRQRLASIGALITILMLFFPTFVQQCIKPTTRDQFSNNNPAANMKRVVKIYENSTNTATILTQSGNGTSSPHIIETDLEETLRYSVVGANTLSTYGFESDVGVSCDGSVCHWTRVNTLALCSSASDISDEITQEQGHTSLPALQYLLSGNEGPPTFQSGSYMYLPEDSVPATHARNGSKLPDLAEIYLLYYDVCLDQGSKFEKTNLTRWVALKGTLQFCIQSMDGVYFRSSERFNPSIVVEATDLDWFKTTKDGQSVFCTKVASERDDFCVAVAVMEHLSYQINTMFTTNATFSDSNRTDIKYGTEWAQPLTQTVFGGTPTPPNCPSKEAPTAHNESWWSGKPPDTTSTGVHGLNITLTRIAHGLSETFRRQSQDVVWGRVQYQENIISVDFYWFILPSVVYAFVALFFVITIFTTRNTPIWKSSSLPLLHATSEFGVVGSEEKIRKQAKNEDLRLSRVGKRWQLVENVDGSEDRVES